MTGHLHSLSSVMLLFASVLLVACGGGDPPPPPTKNFTSTSTTVETADPQIGHPMDVTVTFTSNETADNVGVSLYAVEKTADPNATPRQYPLGSHALERVEAGTNELKMRINIPSNIDLPGQYYLTAVVDPADIFGETNEDDNTASAEVTFSQTPGPNIKLVQLNLDRNALLVNTASFSQEVTGTAHNVYNSDAAGTMTVGADGLETNETIDIDAYATLRINRTDTNTTHDVPLYLWNTTAQRYITAYGVDPNNSGASTEIEWLPLGTFNPQLVDSATEDAALDDVDRDTARIEFYFPGKLGRELEVATRHIPIILPLSPGPTIPPPDLTNEAINALRSFLANLPQSATPLDESAAMAVLNFAICVDIRPSSALITDRDTLDNESCAPITITLPPLPVEAPNNVPPSLPPAFQPYIAAANPSTHRVTPVPNNTGKPTKGGNSFFGYALDFGSTISADNHGYIEEQHGHIPLTIFGFTFDFMKIDVRAQLIPTYTGMPANESSSFTIELRHVGQLMASVAEIPSDVEVAIDLFSISKEYPKKPFESTVFVGPIPLSMGGNVSGNFGFDYQPLVFTTEHPGGYALGVSGGPSANIEARAYAGFGRESVGFIAGVEGILRLLEEKIEFFNGVDIEVITDGDNITVPAEFVIRQGPKITNIFTGPQGFINLFAKYTVPTIKTCKVGPFKVPCPGFKTIKATKNIYKTKALFQFTDVLYENNSLLLDVVVAPGAEPIYYAP